jgi:hypothetical protein
MNVKGANDVSDCLIIGPLSTYVLIDELEARIGIEPTIRVLQTHALPLGHRASNCNCSSPRKNCQN